MSLGNSNWDVTAGGGQQRISGKSLARAVVQLGCSTLGTKNTVVKIGDPSGLAALLDAGQLPEAMALRLRSQTAYGMPLEPSIAGAVSTTTHVGSGTGTLDLGVAPHKLVEILIETGGALGTMAIQYRVGGSGAYSARVVSVAGGSWVYRVPGTFCTLTFPAGTYTATNTLSFDSLGSHTVSTAASTAGSVTSSAGPFTINYGDHWNASIDEGTPQVFTFHGTQGFKTGSASSFSGSAGTIVVRVDGKAAAQDITCTFLGTENTLAKVLAIFNGALLGAHAIDDGSGHVKLHSDRFGTSSSINIISGTAGTLTDVGLTAGAGTAGTVTVDKDSGGFVSKSVAFLDAATAAELAVALVVTGATLTAVTGALALTSSTTGASPKGVQVESASSNVLGFATTEHNGTTGGVLTTVTAETSPIDNYDGVITIVKAGDRNTAKMKISLDGGKTALPPMLITVAAVAIPGAGLYVVATGTFDIGDTYTFRSVGPSPSTQDLADGLAALRLDRTFQSSLIHVITLPDNAADAMTQAETLDAAMISAFNTDGLDWQALCECPVLGDLVLSGVDAIADVDDTDSVITDARQGLDLHRTALNAATHRMASKMAGSGAMQLRRPLGWALVDRYVDTDPRQSLAAVADGKLNITVVGRDEAVTPGLDDVQINTVRTYREEPGAAYLSITSGGFGWKNLSTSADWGDAEAVRLLDVFIAALRARARRFLGQRPQTNPDGTITEKAAAGWDTPLNDAAQKAVGLKSGGDFAEPQASSASARILRSSQLGTTPRRLDIAYTLQPLGFVSDVDNKVFFSGTLTVTA